MKVSTWIPAASSGKIEHERIDRIHYKGKFLRCQHAEIIGPERLPSSIKWPTGPDHRLILADFVVSDSGK